ncbi:MFS transporter [Wolbachia endosymbiont of Dirofilaria (Dirofilaria) immitis]|uniref:MFS transporter n=1 Tax=Wolbachia endosymbiont of Dirofilaria (Dirofilaria) immitis TaxID=1812115 RepID=UPI00158E9360|nr:MFS transporter [Wolbachia endosymbiont of Dirofilaria (Dirofilaria) immitis]QKX02496.1 MFS transporter [Wolbachia endosymbiont of Dirofilaria (Dirofilaria) immitis]
MNNIQKAIISGIICNMIIWYELTLFGVLTHIISDVLFSSESSEYVKKIKFLGSFAIGFGFRPLGAFVFGYIGDKYGRRKILLASVILASISSTAIAVIPSAKKIGIFSPILLLFCRIIQGMATGGETSINSAFLIEHSSDKKNLGFLGSMKAFSGALGSITCFVMIAICKKLTGENYEVWGWRLLFYFSSIMGIIGFLIRYIIEESLAYKMHSRNKGLFHSPFLELLKKYKRAFMIAIGLGIAQNAIVYSTIMFYNISVKEIILSGIDIKNVVRIMVEITFGVSAVLLATLSDKVGRKNVMIPTLIILACVSLLVFPLLSYNNHYIVMLTFLLISIPIGASFGIYNSLICELFPTKVRCTGFSLAHNVSAGVFGGISPSICMWLIEKTETKFASGIYLTACALISLVSILQIKDKDKKVDW